MSAFLLEMEKEVLVEGREWTRRRLQERLQGAADAIPPVCEQSGLVLKRQTMTSFTLMTVSGTVSIDAMRGYAPKEQRIPARGETPGCKWEKHAF